MKLTSSHTESVNHSRPGRRGMPPNGWGKGTSLWRWASLCGGVAAASMGIIGFVYLLWGPSYRESTVLAGGQRLPDSSHGLLVEGVERLVLLQLAGLAIEITGVAIGSYVSFRGKRIGTLLLWTCTFLLSLQIVVSFFGFGWLFMPAAILAIIASVTARDEGSKLRDGRLATAPDDSG